MNAFIGLIIGIFLGYIFQIPVTENESEIFAVVIMAALASIFGGYSAKLNFHFIDITLIVSFFSSVAFGISLILLGNILEIKLYYIALLIFGFRIFESISEIRKFLLKKYET